MIIYSIFCDISMYVYIFQEEHYKKLYESEVADHKSTQNSLQDANRKISDLQEELARAIQEQEAKLALAQKQVHINN